MSAALLPAALPATRDSPSIAPHLLHSPSHSDAQHIMHDLHNPVPNAPHLLYYPSSPPPEPASSPVGTSITSPSGMLVVHSYGPASGPPGAPLTAQVDFRNYSSSDVHLRIVFGDLALPTIVIPNAPPSERETVLGQDHGDWSLKISVPPVGQASIHMAEPRSDGRPQWPLTLQAIDVNGKLMDAIGFGFFIYEDQSEPPKPRSRSPKRARSDDDDLDSPPTPTKRLAMDTEAMNLRRMSVASADSSYLSSRQGPTANRVLIEGLSPAPSQTLPSAMTLNSRDFQPQLQLQAGLVPRHMPPDAYTPTHREYLDEGPALIRTTQLGSDADGPSVKSAQASVAIQGDLDDMAHGWSDAERISRRRLVQFWKRQVGTTLHISFAAIPQHQYTDNTIVVSCVYRDNIEECFITSVDIIYLLEALAGNRFEVEEKNRIRRNLEGFKPMTISKNKPGTERFFRTIMDFAAPRPRNIEKDVKVFAWGKLKMMLEKVFSKYSTVPIMPNTSFARYDSVTLGPSRNTYPSASENAKSSPSNELSQPRSARSRSPGVRRKCSPGSTSRPQETQNHVSLPISHVMEHAYTEPFVPIKYNDALDYNTALEPGDYAFGELRYDMPSGIDPGLFKVDAPTSEGGANASESVNGVGDMPTNPEGVDRQLRVEHGFRPASPLSSDNSPTSLSLSFSSGASSDGGNVESQDTTSVSPPDAKRLSYP